MKGEAKIEPRRFDLDVDGTSSDSSVESGDDTYTYTTTTYSQSTATKGSKQLKDANHHHHHHHHHHHKKKFDDKAIHANYRHQLKERIIKTVMDEVLPDIGAYDLDSSMATKTTILSGVCIEILKFFGCAKLTLHETALTGNERWLDRKIKEIQDECEKKNTLPAAIINEYDAVYQQTALSMVVKGNRFDMVDLLLAGGAKPDLCDLDTGRSPLLYSVLNGTHGISNLLLNRGASVDMADSNSVTPLMLACLKDDIIHCRMLVAKLSDFDAQDNNGWTPLHYCAYGNAPECALYLVGEGARRDLRDRNKKKALHIARHQKYGEVISVLEDVKARIAFAMGEED